MVNASLLASVTVVLFSGRTWGRNHRHWRCKIQNAWRTLRYKSCTDEDIALLRSGYLGTSESKQKLSCAQFRHSASSQHRMHTRDKINNWIQKFAHSMGTSLHQLLLKDKCIQVMVWEDAFWAIKSQRHIRIPVRSKWQHCYGLARKSFGSCPHGTKQKHHPEGLHSPGMPVMIKAQWGRQNAVAQNGAEPMVGRLEAHWPHSDKLTLYLVVNHNHQTLCNWNACREMMVPVSKQTISSNVISQLWSMCFKRNRGASRPTSAMTDLHPRKEQSFQVIDVNNLRSINQFTLWPVKSASLLRLPFCARIWSKKIQGLTGLP